MRKNSPVQYNERADIWNIYRYVDVRNVLANFVDFSSDFTKIQSQQFQEDNPFARTLISYDPPFHRYLRNTVSSAFSLPSMQKLGPRITDIANDLIDKVLDTGSMDLARDFAYPLPV